MMILICAVGIAICLLIMMPALREMARRTYQRRHCFVCGTELAIRRDDPEPVCTECGAKL
jgi:DNA-directed RNA polymerase subunit RPC12/RpoP